MHQLGVAQLSLAMVISGTIGWFVLASGQAPMEVVFWRCAFGALALGGWCWITGAFRVQIRHAQVLIAAAGGAAIVLNWILLFASYRHASVAISTAVYNVQPFILLAFGVVLFGERLSALRVGLIGAAFLGLLLVVLKDPEASYVGGNFTIGIALAIGAAFGWAVASATAKKLAGVPPQLIAFIHVCVGLILLLPFVDFAEPPSTLSNWGVLATVGFAHTGLMYALMYSAVQKLPTYVQGPLTFINPVVAILVDVLLLGHALSAIQLSGIALIVTAAAGMSLPLFLKGWRARREPAG